MTKVRTTCPYCGVGCGVLASSGGAISGDPAHPANQGRLCSKGTALGETLDLPDRLLRPLIEGREATWDEALNLIAGRIAETVATDGPEAVALYASGQLLTEDYYVANKLMKGFIGSANIDTNSRLCMASSVAGHIRAFGEDVVPGVYEDWSEADLAVLVGSNTAWCHPVLYQRLIEARERRGTRIVTIDPRRTATSEVADLHLPLAADTDIALFGGLLADLNRRGCGDARWVAQHTAGIDRAIAAVEDLSVGKVAAITRLPQSDIERFYQWFAETERTVTAFSQGVNQSTGGTDKVDAIINCHLATGRIGRPGMGPFSITGQPNAMGGREVGGFANQLAAHVTFDDPDAVAAVATFWHAPQIAMRPGLKAVDMFEAVAAGKIKALWIMATNPAASLPRAGVVREALERCPFVVVSDCWHTDTTRYADVVLPAMGWGEKDGTVTNSERCISRQRRFRPAPGEARPDWWMINEVGRRLGWGKAFSYRSSADIFREHAALSAFHNDGRRAFDIGGLAHLSDADYDRLEPIRWPVHKSRGTERMFGDGRFSHRDGRARFIATPWRSPDAGDTRRFPFVLNTGRLRDQWHTMTRTGGIPRLMTHQAEPRAMLHSHDAAKLGVSDNDLVRVETAHGATVLAVAISDGQRIGEIFVAMHWTDAFSSAGPVNRLVSAARDPISGQPELKATRARLAPVPTLWRGVMVSSAPPAADIPGLWARIPLAAGQALVLRGWEPIPELGVEAWAGKVLPSAAGTTRWARSNPEVGLHAFATTRAGKLESCLFLSCSRRRGLPDRDRIEALLGANFSEDSFAELMKLAPKTDASGRTAASAIICACYSVRATAIKEEIAGAGLTTVAEIGAALRAGTNCGSCIPELKMLLRETAV